MFYRAVKVVWDKIEDLELELGIGIRGWIGGVKSLELFMGEGQLCFV